MTDLPRTPSPRPRDGSHLQLTPEQVKQFENNRLKGKAKQRERELEASSSTNANSNGKRRMAATTSDSPTTPQREKALKPERHIGKYLDYDLSKMVNSKAGFLVEDEKEVDEERIRKEKHRERQRQKQTLDPPIHLDPSMNPQCIECRSIDIDPVYKKVFGCLICKTCQNEHPEKYSLLTKTECKEDYLLTDAELRDQEAMPHLLKANPHKSTYANMMLYLRCQVEDFAWKKWGSPEEMDAEFEKRTKDKLKKKNRKFEQSLRELRRKTKEGVWQKRKDEEHVHVFGPTQVRRGEVGKQVCHECGFSMEVEEL